MGKGKGGRGKAKAQPVEEPEVEAAGDEDEEMEEDEYAVENIVSHRFEPDIEGTLKLEVKWIGWPDSANTWEPEENLGGCEEEVKTYYDEIGGKPAFGQAKSRKSMDSSTLAEKPKSRKRQAESTPASDTPEPKRGSRASKKLKTESKDVKDVSMLENGKDTDDKKFVVPKGSWEDEIVSISTVERLPDGSLQSLVHWRHGHTSHHKNIVLNVRCPQKMLQFYEAHLRWSTPENNMKYAPFEKQVAGKEVSVAAKEEERDDSKDVEKFASSATEMLDAGVANLESGIKDVVSTGVKAVASIGAQVKDVVTKSATPAPSVAKSATPAPNASASTPKPVSSVTSPTTTPKAVATKAGTPASTSAPPETVAT